MKPQGNLGRAILRYGYAVAAVTVFACSSSGGSGDSNTAGAGGTKSGSAGGTAKGGSGNHAGTKSTAESGAAGESQGEAGAANGATSGVGGGTSTGGGTGTSGSSNVGAAGEAGAPGIPDNDLCTNAKSLQLGTTQAINIAASTLNAQHDIDPPCASGAGPDVFYEFDVSKRVFVYADTFGASWNTVLYLLSEDCKPLTTTTTAGDSLCDGTACGTSQSQIVALLEAGHYKLGLSGRGGAAGSATIHFQFTLAGSGTAAQLPAGSNMISGTTSGASGNMQAISPTCLAAGPENAYWWTSCPNDAGGAFTASTCDGGAAFESVLALELPASAPYTCELDSCGLQSSISSTIPAGAGLRVLAVDGQGGSDKGAYTVKVSRP